MFETNTQPKNVPNQSIPVQPIRESVVSPTISGSRFSSPKRSKKPLLPLLVATIIILGITSGYLASGKKSGGSTAQTGTIKSSGITVGSEFGGKDELVFKDQAIGVIETGGIDGEGTHKLLREGGVSQTVYLTSSTLDLESFNGRKVQIWGETFRAQKAGWLMDVGRLKVLE